MSTEPVLVVGYIWKNGAPHLQVRGSTLDTPTRDMPIPESFYLRKLVQRHCVGWINFDRMEIMPCPDKAELDGRETQCNACRQREGFLPCVMCNGINCPPLKPAVERYCHQPHHLYLACFGDQQVKVGTASHARKHLRILEQGPLYATYVASAPGPKIKQIENAVSQLGYTEMMRRANKLSLLTSGMQESEAKRLVLTAFQDIQRRISPAFSQYFHEPEQAEKPPMALAARNFARLEELQAPPEETFGGRLLAASGSFVVLDDGVNATVLDLVGLKSWMVKLDPDEQPPLRAKQLSLF